MRKWPLALVMLGLSCGGETFEPTPSKLIVVPPTGYTKSVKYPLFIALHGAGGTKESMAASWRSERLSDSYIVAYIESMEPAPEGGFTWYRSISEARQQIRGAYWALRFSYSIDTTKVVIGGISAGGGMALDAFFTQAVPATAFVCLSPVVPTSVTPDRIVEARGRSGLGVMITTEDDYLRPSQEQMLGLFRQLDFECGFVLVPGVHGYPSGFRSLLDEALDSFGWVYP